MDQDRDRKKAPRISRARNFKLRFGHPLAPHIFLWLGAAAATAAIFTQTPAVYGEIVRHALEHPQVVLYEYIAALLLIYFAYFACGKVWLAVGVPSLFLFFVVLINKFKVFLRGDPFMPSDIILRGEAFNIASASSIKIGAGSVILLILMVAGCAALGFFVRFRKERAAARLIGGALTVALAAASYFGIYTNDALYAAIPVRNNVYNMVNEFNSKGFIFAFLHHVKDLNLGALRPDGYSESRAREILAKYADGEGEEAGARAEKQGGDESVSGAGGFRPDVIFLMSEAFWDITAIPALVFDGTDGVGDPVPVFHRLEKICPTGELYNSVYGGGTDTTEYNILTGHSIANFEVDVSSAYKLLVRNNVDSVVRAFSDNGYSAVALHPGFPWFYNRRNVYPWLGFEEFVDISAFDEAADKSGNYISDYAMTDRLIEIYDGYTGGNEAPLFCFTVTIQNHGPYDAGYMYGQIPKNYLTTPGIALSIKGDYAITNYIRGIQDADASLGRLTDYLEPAARPAVLVFFGDHLPGLGSNFAAYNELGYPIGNDGGLAEKANVYRNRYIIWANRAAREAWPEYEAMKAAPRRMSANYLGVYAMEILGLELSPYERLVADMRGRLPVYQPAFYSADRGDGAPLIAGRPEQAGAELADLIAEYKIVQYYKIFDEKYEEGVR